MCRDNRLQENGVATRIDAAPSQQTRKTFVVIHGAWHGGWCWRRVADRLEQRGHKVFAPTVTGVGERSHLMSDDIDLDTHITDIVNVFKWEYLEGSARQGCQENLCPCGRLSEPGIRQSISGRKGRSDLEDLRGRLRP
jgi:hypothetical protein